MIYYEFVGLNVEGGFRDYVSQKLAEIKKKHKQFVETADAFEEIDGFR